jgi:hypothetical protein
MTKASIERRWVEAIASVLLVMLLPVAVGLQMEIGGALSVPSTDPNPPLDYWLRIGLWAAAFFAPFVVGAILGAHALGGRPSVSRRILSLAGLLGNLSVIALALLFAIGEVTNPH